MNKQLIFNKRITTIIKIKTGKNLCYNSYKLMKNLPKMSVFNKCF